MFLHRLELNDTDMHSAVEKSGELRQEPMLPVSFLSEVDYPQTLDEASSDCHHMTMCVQT